MTLSRLLSRYLLEAQCMSKISLQGAVLRLSTVDFNLITQDFCDIVVKLDGRVTKSAPVNK